MVESKENLGEGPGVASGGEPTPTPTPTTPKVELKDGHILVDGKKMVAESDLIAAKHGLEDAAEKAQTAHNEAIDTIRLELSSEQQKAASLAAELERAKQASVTGAVSDEEIARIKQEREDALSKVETLQTKADKALDYRRALLVTQFGVPADKVENKTMEELDSFEEALKALATSRGGGPGNYLTGGGGAQPHTMTQQERAAKVIEGTPIRGTRQAAEPVTK